MSSHPSAADDLAVDLQLVLAVDVSPSMEQAELILQRQGYVAAFRHPQVVEAIGAGAHGRIAVTYVEWAGSNLQRVVVPWHIITGGGDASAFADDLQSAPLASAPATSISGGLVFASGLFARNDAESLRRTIDVSGDGVNNSGPPVAFVRDRLIEEGITINGLPILIRPTVIGVDVFDDLDVYYQDCVIGGPGAFMITVNSADGFEMAIRRKLVLEIAGLPPRVWQAADPVDEPRVDCQIGERMSELLSR